MIILNKLLVALQPCIQIEAVRASLWQIVLFADGDVGREEVYRTKEGLEGRNMESHLHHTPLHPKVDHLSTVYWDSKDGHADLTHSSSHYPQREEVGYLLNIDR